jgi:hypothetical protein
MVSTGLLRRAPLVRTDVSEEPGASIRVTKIGELGTTQAAVFLRSVRRLLVAACSENSTQRCNNGRFKSQESGKDYNHHVLEDKSICH